jgi:enoyl-CoA hydratase
MGAANGLGNAAGGNEAGGNIDGLGAVMTKVTELANGRLLITRDGAIARITFNKPERMNAMSLDMWEGLNTALDSLASDDSVRVVVLQGAGEKAFISGADISEFDELRATEEGVRRYNAISEAADKTLYDFPKPTIAQVRGYCVGGGMGLAIACDIRICADDARLGITAAKLGLGYGFDGVRKLVELAGPEVAAQVLYSAKLFTAEQAQRMRLVSEVVSPADLEPTVTALANRIANNAPLTIAAAKAAIRAVNRPDRDAHRAAISELTARCFASEDFAEGRRAFAEKRPPKFVGH